MVVFTFLVLLIQTSSCIYIKKDVQSFYVTLLYILFLFFFFPFFFSLLSGSF